MRRLALRGRLRSRRVQAALAAVVVIVAAIVAVAVSRYQPPVRTSSQYVTGTPEAGRTVRLDTTVYFPERTPAPAVVLAHGFGGTKDSVAAQARTLARHGYVVLAYTARGFGLSGGLIHLDAPDYEVHDASLLVTYLTRLPQVEPDKIAVAGASYGGGLALLLAAYDHRIKAVGADITWNDLRTALFPNAAGAAPGVFKKLWTGYLFQLGFGLGGSSACGRFAADICAGYQDAATTGLPDPSLLRLLAASSPSSVLNRITAPTLLTQGEQDSLFPLSQADANARGIAAHGTPVRVEWRAGGHDDPSDGTGDASNALISWLGAVFGGDVHGTQPFVLAERGSAIASSTGRVRHQTLQTAGYPGIDGTAQRSRTVTVSGPAATVTAPAGGNPAAVNALPVLGSLLDQLNAAGPAAASASAGLATIPGQTAAFVSRRLGSSLLIAGSASIRVEVTANQAGDLVLYAGLRDVAPDGTSTLPSQLVAPLRLTGLRARETRTVTVTLPAVVRTISGRDRIEITFATTDLAYQTPPEPRTYVVALAHDSTAVRLPTVSGSVLRGGHPSGWLITGAALALLCALAVMVILRRRRRVLRPEPALADVPIAISGLGKVYAGGYRAVDAVSFRVERGQVVGLLGPNGAGKTTVLRVLVGLITPSEGSAYIFGQPVLPGAAVLARVGAFIEGPGFLPHLSGRENLRLYWAATGRRLEEAEFETALDIAGLGVSVDRRVKTYSHGMKQRLGIAQAMLGLPEVLVLDEPTNGLDPPQIAEMREVLQSYARTGRTVVVSSHLLAEVEQTCTHVVVMHKGRLVAAGSVAEIAGAGGMQLAVSDAHAAAAVLAEAGIAAAMVPARRALEDVFLDLVGGGDS